MMTSSEENFEFLEVSIRTKSSELLLESKAKRKTRAKHKIEYDGQDLEKSKIHMTVSMENFIEILSSIGERVEHVRMVNGNAVILQTIRQHCKNLKRIELLEGEGSLPLQNFENLSEMKLPNVRMQTHSLRKCFTNNPNLESLEYDYFWYYEEFEDILKWFPKLKSLHIRLWQMELPHPYYANDNKLFESIISSQVLTKLAIHCDEYSANEMLMRLTGKLNLVELDVIMVLNAKIWTSVSLFGNLEMLSVTHTGKTKHTFPKATTLPPKLKRLQLKDVHISGAQLLWIVEKHRQLNELHIGTTNAELHPWLHNDKTISEIATKLNNELSGRRLKIFFRDENTVAENPYKYNADNLEIINCYAADSKTEPLRI